MTLCHILPERRGWVNRMIRDGWREKVREIWTSSLTWWWWWWWWWIQWSWFFFQFSIVLVSFPSLYGPFSYIPAEEERDNSTNVWKIYLCLLQNIRNGWVKRESRPPKLTPNWNTDSLKRALLLRFASMRLTQSQLKIYNHLGGSASTRLGQG